MNSRTEGGQYPVKRWRFHWLDGKKDEVSAIDVSSALTKLGYGMGALRALDYWEEIKDRDLS